MKTLNVWVGTEIIYLYGTVNGEEATFTLVGDGCWQATVPRSEDDSYVLHLEAYSADGLEGTYDYTLYYGMRPLVTDRTAADVERVKSLIRKINRGIPLTEAEQAEWDAGMKGAYNADDLNRVSGVVQYLSDTLGMYGYYVPVTGKANWAITDIPRASDMEAYLGDVQAIKDKFYGATPLPASMDDLTHTDANNIEKLLEEIETYINRMVAGFRKCGTFKCGQGVILP